MNAFCKVYRCGDFVSLIFFYSNLHWLLTAYKCKFIQISDNPWLLELYNYFLRLWRVYVNLDRFIFGRGLKHCFFFSLHTIDNYTFALKNECPRWLLSHEIQRTFQGWVKMTNESRSIWVIRVRNICNQLEVLLIWSDV